MESLIYSLDEENGNQPVTAETRRVWISLINDLPERIAGLAANTRFIRLVGQINDRTAHILDLDLQHPGHFAEIAQATTALIDLLMARDVAGAVANLEGQSLARASVLRDLVKEGNALVLEAGPSNSHSFEGVD